MDTSISSSCLFVTCLLTGWTGSGAAAMEPKPQTHPCQVTRLGEKRPPAPATPKVASVRGDLDGDGTSDLLWRHADLGAVYAMPFLKGVAQAGTVLHVERNPAWECVATGDLDGDGRADLIWRNVLDGQVYGQIIAGMGFKAEGLLHEEPDLRWQIVTAADADGDGKADLIWRNRESGQVCLMRMDGLAKRDTTVLWSEPSQAWELIGAADFNGDGKADLFWRHRDTGLCYVLYLDGPAVIGGLVAREEPDPGWLVQALADLDGDGCADIVFRHLRTGQVWVQPMVLSGPAPYGTLVHTETNQAWEIASAADFDGDGKADLMWRNRESGDIYLMRMDGFKPAGGAIVWQEPDLGWNLQGPGLALSRERRGMTFSLPRGASLELIGIPGGSFTMGAPEGEPDSLPGEHPPHQVTVSPFFMARFETTQQQWEALMKSKPSYFSGSPFLPVEQVSWYDIHKPQGFLEGLNAVTGHLRPSGMVFRLPTEAEWEYACRAGTTTPYHWGDNVLRANLSAWLMDWSHEQECKTTHPVGTTLSNAFGLYDMTGNVCEICQDRFAAYSSDSQVDPVGPASGYTIVQRGGSWQDILHYMRSASRQTVSHSSGFYAYGFRVVLGAPRKP